METMYTATSYYGNSNVPNNYHGLFANQLGVEIMDLLDELNKAGEHMKKNGYNFFLHNHHYEFMRMTNGERIFDYMVENAPHINLTLDIFWSEGFSINLIVHSKVGRIGPWIYIMFLH